MGISGKSKQGCSIATMTQSVTFQVALGSAEHHQSQCAAFEKAASFVRTKGSAFGLSSDDISKLDPSERETLADLLRDQRVVEVH